MCGLRSDFAVMKMKKWCACNIKQTLMLLIHK